MNAPNCLPRLRGIKREMRGEPVLDSVARDYRNLAGAVGVSRSTLYNWMDGYRRRDGKWTRPMLPYEAVAAGRARRIRRTDLFRVAARRGAMEAMEAVQNW